MSNAADFWSSVDQQHANNGPSISMDGLNGLNRVKRAPPSRVAADGGQPPLSGRDLTAGPSSAPSSANSMSAEESRLRQLMKQLSQNPYMPSQDQLIQLLSIALTLILTAYLGPLAGANAALVGTIVKQVVPIIVAATMQYAASLDGKDTISDNKPLMLNADHVALSQLSPVEPASSYSQTIA